LEGPLLYPYQRELAETDDKDLVILSGTGLGKSYLAAAWKWRRRAQMRGSLGITAAPTEKQTLQVFNAMRELCRPLLVPGPRGVNEAPGNRRLRFLNGSEEQFRSWDVPDNLRGPHAHDVLADEGGMLSEKADGILSSRRSATLGPMFYIGNPGPIMGPFWKLCERAQDPANAGRYVFRKWTYRDKLAMLFDARSPFHDPERAKAYKRFIDNERDSREPFEFEMLYEANFASPPDAYFAGWVDKVSTLDADPNPHKGHPYIVGWDYGEDRDFTVGAPLCLTCLTVTDLFRTTREPSTTQKRHIAEYTRHWNEAYAVLETNGPGGPVYDEVEALYPKTQKWWTDETSKRNAIFTLSRLGRNGQIRLAKIPPLQQELKIFRSVRAQTGRWSFSAPDGMHDDCVMALLIAVASAYSGASAYLNLLQKQIDEQDEQRRKALAG